jgi:hypothetical protein
MHHTFNLSLVTLSLVIGGSANGVGGIGAVASIETPVLPAPVLPALTRLVETLHAERLVADTMQRRVYRETARRMGIARWDTVTPPAYYTAVMSPRMAGLPHVGAGGEPMMVAGLTFVPLRATFLQPTFQRIEGLIAHEAVHQLRGDSGCDHTNWPTNAAPLDGMDVEWRAAALPGR